MITFFNDRHALHHGKMEMFRGELVPCFEIPARLDHVLNEVKARKLGAIETPPPFGDEAITRVHSQRYVDFLTGAWDEWVAFTNLSPGWGLIRRASLVHDPSGEMFLVGLDLSLSVSSGMYDLCPDKYAEWERMLG